MDQRQTDIAFDGFRRFGKRRHPARLDYDDCFSYALATAFNEPRLFNFSKADISAAGRPYMRASPTRDIDLNDLGLASLIPASH